VVAQSHSRAAETELGADAATLAGGGVRLSGCLKSGGGGRSAAREGADDECAPWMWCDRTDQELRLRDYASDHAKGGSFCFQA